LVFPIWSILKLGYLYLCYWLVGLEEEEFYIPKANYCADIGWYNVAIRTYEKALNESSDPMIHAALGWCYSEIRNDEKALEHYRIAYSKKASPEFGVGLAFAEYTVGNLNEFQKIYSGIKDLEEDLSPELKTELVKLSSIKSKIDGSNLNIAS
jgi:tetratricopeptide (TPR) repeat protein